jgi:hypothetical protein
MNTHITSSTGVMITLYHPDLILHLQEQELQ